LIDEKSPAGFLAGQYKYRHGQRRRAQCGEVFRILFKVAEVLEAGTHAARLCISFRIELPVGFGDGMFRVGGEVVPEMLEVDSLASVNKC